MKDIFISHQNNGVSKNFVFVPSKINGIILYTMSLFILFYNSTISIISAHIYRRTIICRYQLYYYQTTAVYTFILYLPFAKCCRGLYVILLRLFIILYGYNYGWRIASRRCQKKSYLYENLTCSRESSWVIVRVKTCSERQRSKGNIYIYKSVLLLPVCIGRYITTRRKRKRRINRTAMNHRIR